MPGKNRHPLLGWHCPADLAAWARAEAGRREIPLSALLTEALTAFREGVTAAPRVVTAQRAPQDGCKHPRARVHKGLCGACGTYVG